MTITPLDSCTYQPSSTFWWEGCVQNCGIRSAANSNRTLQLDCFYSTLVTVGDISQPQLRFFIVELISLPVSFPSSHQHTNGGNNYFTTCPVGQAVKPRKSHHNWWDCAKRNTKATNWKQDSTTERRVSVQDWLWTWKRSTSNSNVITRTDMNGMHNFTVLNFHIAITLLRI